MAIVLAENDIWKVSLYSTLGSQLAVQRCFFVVKDMVGTPDDGSLGAAAETSLGTKLKDCMVVDASFRGIGVQRVWPAPKTRERFFINLQGAGTVVTPPLPKQVSGLITLRTDYAGRQYRGRTYVPFPGEIDSDGVEGRPTANYVARLDTLGNFWSSILAIGAGGNTANGNPVLWKQGQVVGTPITADQGRPYWATQRRRGDYGAKNTSPI